MWARRRSTRARLEDLGDLCSEVLAAPAESMQTKAISRRAQRHEYNTEFGHDGAVRACHVAHVTFQRGREFFPA